MIKIGKVRGTQVNVPKIEINIDTVYVRENIIRIESEEFKGWEYDETQYGKNEYIENIAKQYEALQRINDTLIMDNLAMQSQIDDIAVSLLV